MMVGQRRPRRHLSWMPLGIRLVMSSRCKQTGVLSKVLSRREERVR